MSRHRGHLFLIIGPSQVGKDAIIRRLLARRSLKLRKTVTVTTRDPRPREVPGKTYHYVSDTTFDRMSRGGDLLEWMHVQTHRSGTPKQPLLSWLTAGHDVIQHIDVQGADALRRLKFLAPITIFILPGSTQELRRRFTRRRFPAAEARVRWRTTLRELARQPDYDFRVVNAEGKLDQAVDEVSAIIRAHRRLS